jgi:hypothetical protein
LVWFENRRFNFKERRFETAVFAGRRYKPPLLDAQSFGLVERGTFDE